MSPHLESKILIAPRGKMKFLKWPFGPGITSLQALSALAMLLRLKSSDLQIFPLLQAFEHWWIWNMISSRILALLLSFSRLVLSDSL